MVLWCGCNLLIRDGARNEAHILHHIVILKAEVCSEPEIDRHLAAAAAAAVRYPCPCPFSSATTVLSTQLDLSDDGSQAVSEVQPSMKTGLYSGSTAFSMRRNSKPSTRGTPYFSGRFHGTTASGGGARNKRASKGRMKHKQIRIPRVRQRPSWSSAAAAAAARAHFSSVRSYQVAPRLRWCNHASHTIVVTQAAQQECA